MLQSRDALLPPTPAMDLHPSPDACTGAPVLSPSLSQVRFTFSAGQLGQPGRWRDQLCPHLCPKGEQAPLSWEGLGAILEPETAAESLRVEMVLDLPGLVLPRVSSPPPPDTSMPLLHGRCHHLTDHRYLYHLVC